MRGSARSTRRKRRGVTRFVPVRHVPGRYGVTISYDIDPEERFTPDAQIHAAICRVSPRVRRGKRPDSGFSIVGGKPRVRDLEYDWSVVGRKGFSLDEAERIARAARDVGARAVIKPLVAHPRVVYP